MASDESPDRDEQDDAEAFDEETLGVGPTKRATFEELPDLLDVTSAVGDADDDAGLIAEDLDDDQVVEIEADADLADPEDDELAARGDEIAEGDGSDVDDLRPERTSARSV
jgi:hypothetical protein